MPDRLRSVIILGSMVMMGYGMWLISPCVMYIGIGSLMFSGAIVTNVLGQRRIR